MHLIDFSGRKTLDVFCIHNPHEEDVNPLKELGWAVVNLTLSPYVVGYLVVANTVHLVGHALLASLNFIATIGTLGQCVSGREQLLQHVWWVAGGVIRYPLIAIKSLVALPCLLAAPLCELIAVIFKSNKLACLPNGIYDEFLKDSSLWCHCLMHENNEADHAVSHALDFHIDERALRQWQDEFCFRMAERARADEGLFHIDEIPLIPLDRAHQDEVRFIAERALDQVRQDVVSFRVAERILAREHQDEDLFHRLLKDMDRFHHPQGARW